MTLQSPLQLRTMIAIALGATTGLLASDGMSPGAQLLIVVIGSLVATVILFAATGCYRWWKRPVLEITVGAGPQFNKVVGEGDEFVAAVIGSNRYVAAHAKCVTVRERRGKASAKNVSAQMVDFHPPSADWLDTDLKWSGQSLTADIQPSGRRELFVQMVILSRVGDSKLRCNITPPMLEHAPQKLEFTLQLVIDGRPAKPTRLRMEEAWSPEAVCGLYDPERDEIAAITYPTLTVLRS